MGFLAPAAGWLGSALGGNAFGGGMAGLLTQMGTQAALGGGISSLLGGDFKDGALAGGVNGLLSNKGVSGKLGDIGTKAVAGVASGMQGTPESFGPQQETQAPTMGPRTEADSGGNALTNLLQELNLPQGAQPIQAGAQQPEPTLIADPQADAIKQIVESLGQFAPTPQAPQVPPPPLMQNPLLMSPNGI